MTQEPNQSPVNKYKRTALTGGIVGLVLIGGYLIFQVVVTPKMPTVQSASAAELVGYIANDRGLPKLSKVEQQQFMERLKLSLLQKDTRKAELKEALGKLDDEQRKKFSASIFEPLKDKFIEEAQQFSRLQDENARYKFIRERVEEFAVQTVFLRDLAQVFKNDWSGPDDYQKWIMEHVTARERAIAEPYVAAIKQVTSQTRKEDRVKQPAAPVKKNPQ